MAAEQKQLTGGRTNYYLVRVEHPQREDQPPYQAECEDIIEALDLTFDEANIFKEIWRSANARKDNGKLGHSAVYGAEKIVHYAGRILRRLQRTSGLDIPKLMADTKREGATATDIRNQMERDIALQKKDMAVNAIQQQAIQDPWIEWLGGRIPVHPTVRVEYRLRRSSTKFVAPAGELSWYWGNNGNPNDIVEYRVIG